MTDKYNKTFGKISRFNHWITALIFIAMLGLGFFLAYGGLEGAEKGPFRDVHKSVGTLFVLWAVWRVGWRLIQGFPEDVSAMPIWQSISAKFIHWLLLVSILAMPLSGVIGSLYGGRSIDIFGWFTVASLGDNETISGMAYNVHGGAPVFISILICIHIAAALKHHFFDKDATLRRMIGK